MAELLAACPFQHDQSVHTEPPYAMNHFASEGWSVVCETCGCEGPREVSEANAVTAWNHRPDTAEIERLREALTPSGDTKAAYMGEFSFTLRRVDEFGDEYSEKLYVPWTTVKEIMAAILARAALSTTPTIVTEGTEE